MQLTEVRIHLCASEGTRLKAYCALTFDDTFVVRDVKLIEGHDGLFLAMPSRRLSDHCCRCGEKNHLRARYCNHCGLRLDENRHLRYQDVQNPGRLKLYADIAHPINASSRGQLERQVIEAYYREVEKSKQPGYEPLPLDFDEFDAVDSPVVEPRHESSNRRAPHGTMPARRRDSARRPGDRPASTPPRAATF